MGLDLDYTLKTKNKEILDTFKKIEEELPEDDWGKEVRVDEDSISVYYRLNISGQRHEFELFSNLGAKFTPLGILSMFCWQGSNSEDYKVVHNDNGGISVFEYEPLTEDTWDEILVKEFEPEVKTELKVEVSKLIDKVNEEFKSNNNEHYIYEKSLQILLVVESFLNNQEDEISSFYG